VDKKEYITNQLKKTFNKKYENYCITRIYHLLNRNDVQIITQQMFHKKDDDKKRTEEIKQQKKIIDEKLAAL